MGWTWALAVAIGHSLAGMALASVCYGFLLRMPLRPFARSVGVGIAFGLAGSLMMSSQISLADGLMVDGRFVTVGLAGIVGGGPASIVSVLIVGAVRATMATPGPWIDFTVASVAGLAGFLWGRFIVMPSKATALSMGSFGALLSLHWIGVVVVPVPNAVTLMAVTWSVAMPLYVLSSVVYGSMMSRERHLLDNEAELQKQARLDHLTGLPNRKAFTQRLQTAVEDERTGGDGFSVLLIDIDHFKAINDTHGHEAGDRALVAIAEVLAKGVSQYDHACRYGGEEFAVFLLYSTPNQAMDKAEKLRRRVEALKLRDGDLTFSMTISIGIASSFGSDFDASEIIARSDEALYKAKRTGRNRVVSCDAVQGRPARPELQLASAA